MPKSKSQPEPLWPYLKYATLSDVRRELPTTLGAWAIASAFTVGIGWAGQVVLPSRAASWESPLPHWANCAIICSIILWFIRGQEFRFRVPLISLGAWLGSSLYIFALCFVVASSPWWIAFPALWGNALFFSLLDTLNAQGKENSDVFEAARA